MEPSSTAAVVVDGLGSLLTGVVKIAAGCHLSLFLTTDQKAWATGENDYGQLGDGTTSNRNHVVQSLVFQYECIE